MIKMPKEIVYKPIQEIVPREMMISPPKFIPNYYEWLMENGTLIMREGFAQDTITTIYTVPANKILYLVYYSMNLISAVTTGAEGIGIFYVDGTKILRMNTAIKNTGQSNCVSLPIPLKLIAGKSIKLYSNNILAYVRGSIFGYLVDKKDIILFSK